MLNLDEIAKLPNTKNDMIKIIKSYPFYVFYGLGFDLEFRYDNYISHFDKPRFIVDRSRGGSVYKGVPVIGSLSEIVENDYCVIVSAPTYVREIVEIAKEYVPEKAIIWDVTVLGSTGNDFSEFLLSNKKIIEDFYIELSDDKSKDTFDCWLRGKVTNDVNVFSEICIPNNYMNGSFIDEETQKWAGYKTTIPLDMDRTRPQNSYFITGLFELEDDAVFYDVGTAYGDTIRGFFEYANVPNGKAIGIELDPKVAQKAQKLCDDLNYDVQIINAGLADKEDTLFFCEGNVGGGSLDVVMADRPNIEKSNVRITLLDTLVEETGLVPSMIKMDIEGAELNALKGAQKTISLHKPVLGICLYHKAEDLITIPQYIKSLNPQYKLYVRHFSITPSELVLFAI